MKDPLDSIEKHVSLFFWVCAIISLAGVAFAIWVILQCIDILRQAAA